MLRRRPPEVFSTLRLQDELCWEEHLHGGIEYPENDETLVLGPSASETCTTLVVTPIVTVGITLHRL